MYREHSRPFITRVHCEWARRLPPYVNQPSQSIISRKRKQIWPDSINEFKFLSFFVSDPRTIQSTEASTAELARRSGTRCSCSSFCAQVSARHLAHKMEESFRLDEASASVCVYFASLGRLTCNAGVAMLAMLAMHPSCRQHVKQQEARA